MIIHVHALKALITVQTQIILCPPPSYEPGKSMCYIVSVWGSVVANYLFENVINAQKVNVWTRKLLCPLTPQCILIFQATDMEKVCNTLSMFGISCCKSFKNAINGQKIMVLTQKILWHPPTPNCILILQATDLERANDTLSQFGDQLLQITWKSSQLYKHFWPWHDIANRRENRQTMETIT